MRPRILRAVKSVILCVRLTHAQALDLHTRAAQADQTISEYVRACIAGQNGARGIPPPGDWREGVRPRTLSG